MTTRLDLNFLETIDLEGDYKPQFVLIQDKNFEREKVPIDNFQFVNCHFQSCVFLYAGGPFRFSECRLDGETGYLNLIGAAYRTMRLLKLYREHMQSTGPY